MFSPINFFESFCALDCGGHGRVLKSFYKTNSVILPFGIEQALFQFILLRFEVRFCSIENQLHPVPLAESGKCRSRAKDTHPVRQEKNTFVDTCSLNARTVFCFSAGLSDRIMD